ncbi:hypothetical protein N3K63_13580 [Microbacterium sp. W1N]|uniref:HAAS signaling domain-containing protein n=1 Tax=Microbacterium festucae TaxID=2977531 RepID=UPI0021C114AA|nr:hypothetical protein [Microbacterium festucae]MCT9821311.1 hypothetical protein [Microbacterium festucae]
MTDVDQVLRDPRVRAYLLELHREVAAVDPDAADAVLQGVADHVREAVADGSAVDEVIADLGDPALIAAAVEPRPAPAAPPHGRFVDSAAAVGVAVLLLTIGTFVFTLVGWAAAMILLWSTTRWTRADKIIGTAVWPATLLSVAVAPALGVVGAGHALIVVSLILPVIAGIWLLVRGLSGARSGVGARVGVGVGAGGATRGGARGWIDGRPALVTVIAAPTVAVAAFGPWALNAAPRSFFTGILAAAIALTVGAVVQWRSRGWSRTASVVGTLLSVAVALTLLATVLITPGGFICSVVATASSTAYACDQPFIGIAAPPAAQLLIQGVIPALLAHAVVAAVAFRAPGRDAALRMRRPQALAVVLLVVVGALGFPLLLMARFEPAGALWALGALGALALWATGIVLLWRTAGWTVIDRAFASGILPLLVAVPLTTPLAVAGAGDNPLLPGGTLERPEATLAWGVFAAVEVVVAVWLLVRFEPDTVE